jgi:predicted nuclease with TOPRIM domain
MNKNKSNKKELTLEDLALMVKGGFDDMGVKFDKLEGRVDNLEGRFDNLEGRFDNLEGRFDNLEGRFDELDMKVFKMGGEMSKMNEKIDRIERGQEELKDIVSGVYHVEIRDLKSRVEILEKKTGIA